MHVFARRSILGGALGAACAACTPAARADLAVTGARLYSAPGTAPIDEATILIGDGRILAAGPGREVRPPSSAQIIDARGGAVVAGFWNSHVHLISHELLHPDQIGDADLSAQMDELFTRWGVTSVFDIASVLASTNVIRQRIRSGAVRGPNILTVGDPFYPLNGTPIYVRDFLEREGVASAEVASVEEGVTRARAQLRAGADGLKLFTGAIVGGDIGVLPMQPDLAQALVEVAHAAGKPAFAHPSNEQGLNVALNAGVDILAHPAFMAGAWDDAMVARLVGRRTALTPTLTLVEVETQWSGESAAVTAAVMQGAQQQVRAFAQAGGDILFGTDIGYTQAYDTAREFRLMTGAGLGFPEILASLTTAPARRFGFARRKGRIAPGMDADLVILAADPAQDIEAFARVRHTIRAGEVIFSA